ncbi:hypothetical protein BC826DRAFT_1136506 [Russula brevipes]|nr:hypothetical protein BC826DRAFT_1136506 [Russula brevipes]
MFLVLLLLTYLNHTHSSTIIIWSRTTLHYARRSISSPPLLALRWGIGGLGVVAFTLECFGAEFRTEPDPKPRLNPESPLLTASIFRVWALGWLMPLLKKGSSQFNTEEDLSLFLLHRVVKLSRFSAELSHGRSQSRSLIWLLSQNYGKPHEAEPKLSQAEPLQHYK